MRRTPIVLAAAAFAAAALATVGLVPAPAGADLPGQGPPARSPRDTHCIAEFDVVFSPGFSQTPASGTFTSNGETGTQACEGKVNGAEVTGVGTRGEFGRYGLDGPNSCTNPGGKGDGTWSFTIPTTAGPQHVSSPATYDYGPMKGGHVFGGVIDGPRMYGTFEITPIEGDCVTRPITKVHARCDEWFVEG